MWISQGTATMLWTFPYSTFFHSQDSQYRISVLFSTTFWWWSLETDNRTSWTHSLVHLIFSLVCWVSLEILGTAFESVIYFNSLPTHFTCLMNKLFSNMSTATELNNAWDSASKNLSFLLRIETFSSDNTRLFLIEYEIFCTFPNFYVQMRVYLLISTFHLK